MRARQDESLIEVPLICRHDISIAAADLPLTTAIYQSPPPRGADFADSAMLLIAARSRRARPPQQRKMQRRPRRKTPRKAKGVKVGH